MELAKVPVPLEVQATAELLVALAPAVMLTAPEFEQVTMAVPATEVGAGVMVMVRSDMPAQVPIILVVNLKITAPL